MITFGCLGRIRWKKLSEDARRALLQSGQVEVCSFTDTCPLAGELCSELDTETCSVAANGDADDHE